MQGFDPKFADFPDYIIGITKEIWEDRGIATLHDYYAPDIVVRSPGSVVAGNQGVIAATTIPWEVVPSLKVQQIVKNHTGFSGEKGLYTQTFTVAMNKASYDKLPADLKKVIDANSGAETAALFGHAMDAGDKVGLSLAQKAGNKIHMLDAVETQTWRRTAAGVRGVWYKEVASKGIDGPKLAAEAEALIAKYSKK